MAPASCWRTEMTIRRILVHLDRPGAVEGLLPAVADLARDLGATGVTAAALGEVPVQVTAASLSLALLQARERDLLDAIDVMRERVESRMGEGQLDWRGAVSPVAQDLLSRWAVRADLIVTSAPTSDGAVLARLDVGELILAAGRPVLIVPRVWSRLRFGRVLIGFKPTREGRAALAASVPFLKAGTEVLLVGVGGSRQSLDLEDASAFLGDHGVRASIRCVDDQEDRGAGRVLLDLAEAERCDLLVTGAYGRSRARELVFGGVTRTLLSRARLPCLMVH